MCKGELGFDPMKSQFDWKKRIVSAENLRAMCDRISGTCHRFAVDRVTANRVHVRYSNPDEYGSDRPVTAVYPAYSQGQDTENPAVVLDLLRTTGGTDSEDWQAFEQINDCPVLWRNPNSGQWETEYEIRVRQYPDLAIRSEWDKDGCIQTWFAADGVAFSDYREAQDRAVAIAKARDEGVRRGKELASK